MDVQPDLVLISFLVALLLPFFLSFSFIQIASSETKSLLSFAICVAVAGFLSWAHGSFDTQNIGASIITVVITAQVAYNNLAKPLGMNRVAERVTGKKERES